MFNQATLKAQSKKWTEHEAKKVKIMEEYNHLISFRFDPLPITKISYVVNTNKEATMKITRGDNPLNLIVHPNFRLRTLGFSEWLEVHALASKKTGKLNDMLLQIDGMQRNLIPPHGVVPIEGFVINEPESGIFFMNRNTDIAFQRESEFHLTPTIQLIRIQNQIKVDSEIVDEMFRKMIYVIEARSDCTKARETAEKNLDDLGSNVIKSMKFLLLILLSIILDSEVITKPLSGGLRGNERTLWVQSLKEQHQTYSSQRHRQGSQRSLEDILVSWDGYQLKNKLSSESSLMFRWKTQHLLKARQKVI
nr:hypothetical protein [Tanacetum cinerariifolium]